MMSKNELNQTARAEFANLNQLLNLDAETLSKAVDLYSMLRPKLTVLTYIISYPYPFSKPESHARYAFGYKARGRSSVQSMAHWCTGACH